MTIDTSVLTANGHALTLDFTNVSRAMEFTFESAAINEVQVLDLGALTSVDQFKLKYGVQEQQRLTLAGSPAGTFQISVPLAPMPGSVAPATVAVQVDSG